MADPSEGLDLTSNDSYPDERDVSPLKWHHTPKSNCPKEVGRGLPLRKELDWPQE